MKIDAKLLGRLAVAGAVAAVMLSPMAAHANFNAGFQASGGGDLSQEITQMANQSSGVPALISWAAYIMGTLFCVIGIMKLKAHSENAAQNKLGPALGFLFTGAAFLIFPSAAALLTKTTAMAGAASTYSSGAFQ